MCDGAVWRYTRKLPEPRAIPTPHRGASFKEPDGRPSSLTVSSLRWLIFDRLVPKVGLGLRPSQIDLTRLWLHQASAWETSPKPIS